MVSEADIGSRDLKAARHKAKTTLHWLSDAEAVAVPAQHNGPLFDRNGECDIDSVKRTTMLMERGLEDPAHYEFERLGYFYFAGGALHHLASLKTAGARTR